MFELVMDDGDSSVSSSGRQMRVGGPDVGSYLRSVTPSISNQIVASIEEHEYEILQRIGDRMRERWIEKASLRLNTTFESYIAGLSDPIISGNTVTVQLANYGDGDGKVPMMIEEGTGPYALNANITKNKFVEFAHGDPRGGTPGTPLGDPYKGHWKFRNKKSFAALQDKLIDQVRRLRSGERLKAGIAPKLRARPRPGPVVSWRGPKGGHPRRSVTLQPHATDIYAGLTKLDAHDKVRRNRLQGTTGRTMAPQFTEAGAGKWIHPGISAYRIGDDVEREIQGIVDSVVLEYGNEGG